MDDDQLVEGLQSGITALQIALDTLALIAQYNGRQGEWAIQALERINAVLRDRVPAND